MLRRQRFQSVCPQRPPSSCSPSGGGSSWRVPSGHRSAHCISPERSTSGGTPYPGIGEGENTRNDARFSKHFTNDCKSTFIPNYFISTTTVPMIHFFAATLFCD